MELVNGIKNFIQILKDKSIQEMASDDLKVTIAAAIAGNPAETAMAIKKTITNIAHLPTYLFWNKMERFLRGTFHSFADQVKMANRFDSTTDDYAMFTIKLVSILDKIEIEEKVDYYANLTRSFLLECIDEELLFKLAKFILQCTMDELQFLQRVDYSYTSPNSIMISALFQYGLIEQGESVNKIKRYKLSDFAKALKQNSLNFYNELNGMKRIGSYTDMKPPVLPSRTGTWLDVASYDSEN